MDLMLLPERLADGSGSVSYQLTLVARLPLRTAVVSVGTLHAPFSRQHLVTELESSRSIRRRGVLALERDDQWIRVAIE